MAEAYIIRSVHQTPGEYAKNTRPRKIADIFHHITSPRNPEKATSARRTMARLLRIVMNFYRKNNRKSSVLQESAAKAIKRRLRRGDEATDPASATRSWQPSCANHERIRRSPDWRWRLCIAVREIFPCATKNSPLAASGGSPICSVFKLANGVLNLQLSISMMRGGLMNKVLLG